MRCCRCHDGIIVDNRFDDSAKAVQMKGGCTSIYLVGNYINNCFSTKCINMGGSTGDEFFRPPLDASITNYEAIGLVVCWMVSNHMSLMALLQTAANVFDRPGNAINLAVCKDCVVVNNAFIQPTGRFFRVLQGKSLTPHHSNSLPISR